MRQRLASTAFLLFAAVATQPGFAQRIELVPNAVTTKYGGPATRDFRGFAVAYAGALYLLYQDTFVRWDGHQMTTIPNPEGGDGVMASQPIVYRDKLYVIYRNAAEHYQLAQLDGTALRLIPNPEPGADVGNKFIIYRDKLYFTIGNIRASTTGLAVFDGDKITEIPGEFSTEHGFVSNDRLYLQFTDRMAMTHVAEFDGTAAKIVKNPDVATVGGEMIGYGSRVLVGYTNTNFGNQLAVYDGTTLMLKPIRNPDAGGSFVAPIEYKGAIWFRYATAAHYDQLAAYDGTGVRLIDPPSPGEFLSSAVPVVYRDHLYLGYTRLGGHASRLVEFDGSTLSYVGAPGIPANWSYTGNAIVFHDKLYFSLWHGTAQLARYDGSTITPIANPEGMSGADTYEGGAFIANDRLYMKYVIGRTREAVGADGNVLAYLNESGVAPKAAAAESLSVPAAAPVTTGPATQKPPALTHSGASWSVSFDDESGKRESSRVTRPNLVNFTPQIWDGLNTQHAGQGMWLAPAEGGRVRIVNVLTQGQGASASVAQVTVSAPVTMNEVAQFVSRYGFQLVQ